MVILSCDETCDCDEIEHEYMRTLQNCIYCPILKNLILAFLKTIKDVRTKSRKFVFATSVKYLEIFFLNFSFYSNRKTEKFRQLLTFNVN